MLDVTICSPTTNSLSVLDLCKYQFMYEFIDSHLCVLRCLRINNFSQRYFPTQLCIFSYILLALKPSCSLYLLINEVIINHVFDLATLSFLMTYKTKKRTRPDLDKALSDQSSIINAKRKVQDSNF